MIQKLSILLIVFSVTTSVAQKQTAVIKGKHVDEEPNEVPEGLPSIPFTESGDVEYQEVVEIPGTSKDELYSRAREWFARTFNSSDAVLEMDDRAAGKLLGKPYNSITVMSAWTPVETRLFYTITIDVKDGRYRYTINELHYKSIPWTDQYGAHPSVTSYPHQWISDEALQNAPNKRSVKLYASYRQETYKSMQGLITSLKKAMREKKSDDW